jgi:hypothetical protein
MNEGREFLEHGIWSREGRTIVQPLLIDGLAVLGGVGSMDVDRAALLALRASKVEGVLVVASSERPSDWWMKTREWAQPRPVASEKQL